MNLRRTLLCFVIALIVQCRCIEISSNATEGESDKVVAERNKQLMMKVKKELFMNQTKMIEYVLKDTVKKGLKLVMPTVMQYMDSVKLSGQCYKSLFKFISGLANLKLWAVRMLDATSKLPPGMLDGTISDFGDYDECLEISVPFRNGGEDFRGKYCPIEIYQNSYYIPENFSVATVVRAGPMDSVMDQFRLADGAFAYLKGRCGICVPSTCNIEDMRALLSTVAEMIPFEIDVPQCYVKEDIQWRPIHIAVICVLTALLLAAITGTVLEVKSARDDLLENKFRKSNVASVFLAFSLVSNSRRLMSESKGSEELKALHGLRALSIAWVMLGHNYVYINFQLIRRPVHTTVYFNQISMEPILNGWLSVESFFFLSGLLTTYATIQVMTKTKGKMNIPIFILRRYWRLTPPMLLSMGLLFFLPILSSGPFWYENIDPQLKACETFWWKNLLYITNWGSVKDICVQITWYLSAEFQLHIFSLLILLPLFSSSVAGILLMIASTIGSSLAIGLLTYMWALTPTNQIPSGNAQLVLDTVNIIHIRTFTHMGPYCVGMLVGYLAVKKKCFNFSKMVNVVGWCVSIFAGLASVYGAHRWNSGHPHQEASAFLYAAVHRTTFIIAVAWVIFVCVAGRGGVINSFLSSPLFAPFGRLTFNIYLLHCLVIWTRMASLRERLVFSHYSLLYEYCGNIIFSTLLAIPCYLLVEAPIINLDRLMFSKARLLMDAGESNKCQPHSMFLTQTSNPVKLSSVTSVVNFQGKDNTFKSV